MTLKRENWGDKFGKRLKKAKVRRMKATEIKDQVKKPQVIKGTEVVGNRVAKTISHPHPEHKGSSVVAHKLK